MEGDGTAHCWEADAKVVGLWRDLLGHMGTLLRSLGRITASVRSLWLSVGLSHVHSKSSLRCLLSNDDVSNDAM